MAGGGSPIARALGQINQAESMGRPGYVPPSALSQGPVAQSPAQIAPQMSPFAQQMMQRSMAPQPIMGLPAALMQMQGQLNRPAMRGPMPQYGTQGNPLAYRPNMAPAMEALNRVRPSVYKTELDAARERLAQYEAAEQARQQASYDYGYNSGGG